MAQHGGRTLEPPANAGANRTRRRVRGELGPCSAASNTTFRAIRLAAQDADGAYCIAGRHKEMYISGGENVFPGEVEAVLADCPGVQEVVVMGVPDARWGEVGCAFIVPRADGIATESGVSGLARARLASYKVPKRIVMLGELPRPASETAGSCARRACRRRRWRCAYFEYGCRDGDGYCVAVRLRTSCSAVPALLTSPHRRGAKMTISLPLAARSRHGVLIAVAGSLLIVHACRPAPEEARSDGVEPIGSANGTLLYPAPDEATIRDSALLVSVRRGRAILAATSDSLPDHVRAQMACTSCHLDDGRRANAMPWVGVYGRFPQYRSREAVVFRLEDRINGCIRRSMNGSALPLEHPAMRDMIAYMSFLSRGVPVGETVQGQGLRRIEPVLVGDTTRGQTLYAARCSACHGADGGGTAVAPALWGENSFNVGAGMARLRTAAAFIRANMPFDRPGSLTDQEAFDVAAWMISRPRPDFAGKELDWPNGDAPPDAAYETLGRQRTAAARQ